MKVRLVDRKWGGELIRAVRADRTTLRIVCPFIKLGALQALLDLNPRNIQVITRFNLVDIATGVSDVAALRALITANARVRGVRNLHAKLYLFGNRRAIITSCNLTKAALSQNYELGIVVEDDDLIVKCEEYFDELWQSAGQDLTRAQVDEWDEAITEHHLRSGRPAGVSELRDFGVNTGLPIATPPPIRPIDSDAGAFVKLLGTADKRVDSATLTLEEIKRAGCHWAACYPAKKRPRRVRDGAVIYFGRLVRDPNDIRVFGRAIGMAHVPGRDDASQAEIAQRPWKEQWPRYLRVHDAEFVSGAMENGVSLNELMDALKADSFASTQRNLAAGAGNTDPRRAYRQQPDVELSPQGLSWLSERLEEALLSHGRVSAETLDELDWPSR